MNSEKVPGTRRTSAKAKGFCAEIKEKSIFRCEMVSGFIVWVCFFELNPLCRRIAFPLKNDLKGEKYSHFKDLHGTPEKVRGEKSIPNLYHK